MPPQFQLSKGSAGPRPRGSVPEVIYHAARNNNADVLQVWFDQGNKPDGWAWNVLLNVAVCDGSCETMRVLIDSGAIDVNRVAVCWTALHYAVRLFPASHPLFPLEDTSLHAGRRGRSFGGQDSSFGGGTGERARELRADRASRWCAS